MITVNPYKAVEALTEAHRDLEAFERIGRNPNGIPPVQAIALLHSIVARQQLTLTWMIELLQEMGAKRDAVLTIEPAGL